MPATFTFAPDEETRGALERAFGASRWVYNHTLMAIWESFQGSASPITVADRSDLIYQQILSPSQPVWLRETNLAMLTDEIDVLLYDLDEIRDSEFKSVEDLPLKRKKDKQEVIFPAGSFKLIDGSNIYLKYVGDLKAPALTLPKEPADAIKIQRTVNFNYHATIYFGDE